MSLTISLKSLQNLAEDGIFVNITDIVFCFGLVNTPMNSCFTFFPPMTPIYLY